MRLHTAPRRVSSASNTTLQFRANKQRSLTLFVPFVFFLGNGIHFSHHHSFSHFRGVPLGVDLHVIHASHTKQRNRFVASVTIGTDIFNSAGGLVGAISPVLSVCCLAFCLVETSSGPCIRLGFAWRGQLSCFCPTATRGQRRRHWWRILGWISDLLQ